MHRNYRASILFPSVIIAASNLIAGPQVVMNVMGYLKPTESTLVDSITIPGAIPGGTVTLYGKGNATAVDAAKVRGITVLDMPNPPQSVYKIGIVTGITSRKDVLLVAKMPSALKGPALYRILDGDKTIPIQIDAQDSSLIRFVLPGELAAGLTKTVILQKGIPPLPNPVTLIEEPKAIELRKDNAKIFRFHTQNTETPAGVGSEYSRSAYIHPLYSPSGMVLTDEYPSDHRAHKGIWNAWPEATFKGRPADFWNLGDKRGQVRFKSFFEKTEGPVYSRISSEIEHVDIVDNPPVVSIIEKQTETVWNPDGPLVGAWVVDYSVDQSQIRDAPIIAKKAGYGGMAFRGAAGWKDGNLDVITSEGKNKTNAHESRARWFAIMGQLGGKWASVIYLAAKENPGYPEPMMFHPTLTLIGFDPAVAADFVMEAGKTHSWRYRMVVVEGKVTAGEAERLWKDFADHPVIMVTNNG